MKTVRILNGIVVEIIPEYGLPVCTWYGEEFEKQCVTAPDYVWQGWIYNANTHTFSEPEVEHPEIK